MAKPKPFKTAGFSPTGPSSQEKTLVQAKAPGGAGFLINHNAFTDARPPHPKGAKRPSY